MLKYNRVSLKLSGEAMGGSETIDFAASARIAREIKTLVEAGVEVGVTIGAGNVWRGRSSGGMDRNRADEMGMLATAGSSLCATHRTQSRRRKRGAPRAAPPGPPRSEGGGKVRGSH